MNQALVTQAQAYLQDILSFFEVNAEVEAETTEDSIELSVPIDDAARLIGHRGETLAAIQHVMNMMIRRQTDERIYVHVDIGGYRKSRLEKLTEQAKTAAAQAKEQGAEVTLPQMNAAERRQIHSLLGEVSGVVSESRGEGNRRRLIVRPE